MEFPSLGEHCQYDECKQIDFLPLQCKCGNVYCREHFNNHCLSGKCDLAPQPRPVNLKNDDHIYKCSEKGCRKANLHEMNCKKCNKHYCIEHRFHPSCPEIDDETMAQKIEEYEAPRRQFAEANKHLQEKITENIRKALQSSTKVKTASKIHLMRIKQKAIGAKYIVEDNRVHFSIKKPVNTEAKPVRIVRDVENIVNLESIRVEPDLKDTIAVFISKRFTLGRAIDSICEFCDIKNDNNKAGTTKVRLFRQLDGYCVSPLKMDVVIEELVNSQILLEGDKLAIEYIDEKILNELDQGQLFLILDNSLKK